MPPTLAVARMTNRGLSTLADSGRAHEAAVAHHENLRRFVGDAYEFQGNSNVCFCGSIFEEVWFLIWKSILVDLGFF